MKKTNKVLAVVIGVGAVGSIGALTIKNILNKKTENQRIFEKEQSDLVLSNSLAKQEEQKENYFGLIYKELDQILEKNGIFSSSKEELVHNVIEEFAIEPIEIEAAINQWFNAYNHAVAFENKEPNITTMFDLLTKSDVNILSKHNQEIFEVILDILDEYFSFEYDLEAEVLTNAEIEEEFPFLEIVDENEELA